MPMAYPITEIRGIGTDVAGILKKEGIRTTIALLRVAKTPKQRLRLAAKTGADSKEILDWVTAADRMRVKGVGFGYAELLRAAGVKTVSDLKLRNPQNLAKRMGNVHNPKLVRVLPKQKTIERWIESAKKLPAIIRY
jgi:predicted flap endonuclease-1-like 5' DNA nuclease